MFVAGCLEESVGRELDDRIQVVSSKKVFLVHKEGVVLAFHS